MAPAPASTEPTLASLLRNKTSARALNALTLSLRRRLVRSSVEIALSTALVLKQIVSNARFSSLGDLLLLLRLVGRELEQANRAERVQGNVVRKVMKLVREEWRAFGVTQQPQSAAAYASASGTETHVRPPSAFSLSAFLANSATAATGGVSGSASGPGHAHHGPAGSKGGDLAIPLGLLSDPFGPSTAPSPLLTTGSVPVLEPAEYTWDATSPSAGDKVQSLKPLLIQAIQEVIDELETVVENVAKGGSSHVHSSCIPALYTSSPVQSSQR